MATAFEWDDAKSASNLDKHGVAFEQAVLVWTDPQLVVLQTTADPESRWMAIGTVRGRVLSVVFTHREPATIRLISARPASRKERATYANP